MKKISLRHTYIKSLQAFSDYILSSNKIIFYTRWRNYFALKISELNVKKVAYIEDF